MSSKSTDEHTVVYVHLKNAMLALHVFDQNACTLVPTVFRWHGEREFKCHFHFSFSHDIEKQIWILLFVFRFRLTLKNGFELRISFSHLFEKRIWISVFVFRFRITLKNGFEFRFSFSYHFEKQIWISFVIFAQSFEAHTPSESVFLVVISRIQQITTS